ncbi:MAG TPA: protein kinase [Micromonosporaceae bacterium]|nr:protein kinase [Micromonosporaceae bacterium]
MAWEVPGYRHRFDLDSEGGRVVLAQQESSGGLVVVKELAVDAESISVARDAVGELRALSADYFVRIREFAEDSGHAAIVMDAVNGPSLRALIRDHGALGPEPALLLYRDVLAGLAYAHELELVHGEVCPENVLVDADGHALMTNAGAVRWRPRAATVATGVYLAPEAWREPPSAHADVYAATVTLVETLAGEPPYWEETDVAALRRRHEDEDIPLDGVPAPLHDVVRVGMAKNAESRLDAAPLLELVETVAIAEYGRDWKDRGRALIAQRVELLALPFGAAGVAESLGGRDVEDVSNDDFYAAAEPSPARHDSNGDAAAVVVEATEIVELASMRDAAESAAMAAAAVDEELTEEEEAAVAEIERLVAIGEAATAAGVTESETVTSASSADTAEIVAAGSIVEGAVVEEDKREESADETSTAEVAAAGDAADSAAEAGGAVEGVDAADAVVAEASTEGVATETVVAETTTVSVDEEVVAAAAVQEADASTEEVVAAGAAGAVAGAVVAGAVAEEAVAEEAVIRQTVTTTTTTVVEEDLVEAAGVDEAAVAETSTGDVVAAGAVGAVAGAVVAGAVAEEAVAEEAVVRETVTTTTTTVVAEDVIEEAAVAGAAEEDFVEAGAAAGGVLVGAAAAGAVVEDAEVKESIAILEETTETEETDIGVVAAVAAGALVGAGIAAVGAGGPEAAAVGVGAGALGAAVATHKPAGPVYRRHPWWFGIGTLILIIAIIGIILWVLGGPSKGPTPVAQESTPSSQQSTASAGFPSASAGPSAGGGPVASGGPSASAGAGQPSASGSEGGGQPSGGSSSSQAGPPPSLPQTGPSHPIRLMGAVAFGLVLVGSVLVYVGRRREDDAVSD